MYDIAKKARAGMKAKAERLAGEKDRKTDSSDWTPAEPLNADVKTGMRPVSRRAYKSGGKVEGCAAPMRADRKPRKAGGRVEQKGEQPLVDRYINRDLKKANEYRDGKKHVGALKHGGRAKKAVGGEAPTEKTDMKFRSGKKPGVEFNKPYPVPMPPKRPANMTTAVPSKPDPSKYITGDVITGPPKEVRKDGGRAKKADGGGMDPRLGIVKNKAFEFGQNTVVPGLKKGGRAEKAGGGTLRREFNQAFREARNAYLSGEGPKTFTWRGKEYGTDLYKPTTGPATRGGTSGAPRQPVREKIIDVQFGAPKGEMPKTDQMGNPNPGMKKGGRIAKQIGGGLGMSANRMMPQLPPQAMAAAQGVPMQGGAFMPPGLAGQPEVSIMPVPQRRGAMPNLPPQAAPRALGAGRPMARAHGGRTKKEDGGLMTTQSKLAGDRQAMIQKRIEDAKAGAAQRMAQLKEKFAERSAQAAAKRAADAEKKAQKHAELKESMRRRGENRQEEAEDRMDDVREASDKRRAANQEKMQKRRDEINARTDSRAADAIEKARALMRERGLDGSAPNRPPSQASAQTPAQAPAAAPPSAPAQPQTDPSYQPQAYSPFAAGMQAAQNVYTPSAQSIPSIAPLSSNMNMGPVPTPTMPSSPMLNAASAYPTFNAPQIPAGGFGAPMLPPISAPATTARAYGGRTLAGDKPKSKGKGKTNINIIIAAGKNQTPDQMMQPGQPAPQSVPMVAPQGAPPLGAPMGGPPMPPMGGQPPMPMPMPRKAGGRVSKVAHSYKDMTAGAGSGEGRLQKTDIAKGRSNHKAGGKVYRSYKDMDAGAGSGEGRLEKTQIQSRKR